MSVKVKSEHGITPWMLLLAVAVVLPILLLLGSFVNGISRQIASVENERQGVARSAALGAVYQDASAYLVRDCDPSAHANAAQIERDIATMNVLERRQPLGNDEWRLAASAWTAKASPSRVADFTARVRKLFPLISDRSGLTFDPEIAAVDLADSLTYRLPTAMESMQQAELLLCDRAAKSVPRQLAISQSVGRAQGYLEDGLREIRQAIDVNPAFADGLAFPRRASVSASENAMRELSAFERKPNGKTQSRARLGVEALLQHLRTLSSDTRPALDGFLWQRLLALHRQRLLTIVLGIVATLSTILIVVFGARNALQRAELSRIRRTAVELHYHATHDALTGLPNRAALVTKVDETLQKVRREFGAAAVLFIDLDNFKLVNDSFGHEAGDGVLCTISQRLQSICAAAKGVLVARFGGDEFAMLISDSEPARMRERIDAVVAQISGKLADPVMLGPPIDQRIAITASVGIALLEGISQDNQAADLLREADAAMYEAKASGRAQAATFGPAMRERAVRKLRLMTDLHSAAERSELALTFQPIVRLVDGAPVGSEALLRWEHPKLGTLAPDVFLPIAIENGSIVPIGRWVFGEAICALSNGSAPAGILHVNVSTREVLENSLYHTVTGLLEEYNIHPSALAIEITEGSLMRSGDRAEAMLRRLRALGAKIWIDDFGVEYSSLRYLHRLPIDGVKIDRTFVGGVDGSLASASIVRLILELARSLDLDIIAEGVETKRQRDALLELGCVNGQGFLFGKCDRLAVPVASSA